MKVFHSSLELKTHLGELSTKNRTIGLVPTMGALHEGHLALIQRAVQENEAVVVSIFVNPTQFDNQEDLENYPKTLKADVSLLENISDDILVFAPSVSDLYSDDITSKKYHFDGLEKIMEGEFRNGHFDGVGTIVEKLLSIVEPKRAYFGEKDFQQLQIIKKLVHKAKLPVEIIGCPIVRESSGLAMSSRNERLSKRLRKEASFIYKTLQAAKAKFGTESAGQIVDWVQAVFKQNPDLSLEYFQITDEQTLKPIKRKQKNKNYRAFIAVYAGKVRLIDNIALN